MDSTKRMALESLLGRFPFDVGAADLLRSLYLFSFYNAPPESLSLPELWKCLFFQRHREWRNDVFLSIVV